MTRDQILELAIANDEKYADLLFEDALVEFACEIVNLVVVEISAGMPQGNVQGVDGLEHILIVDVFKTRQFVESFKILEVAED